MDINGYLNEIRSLAASGRATEHSYRPALERLFASIDDNVKVINEPKQSAVGAPDFVFERKGVSVGWCEAKDIFKDITKFKSGDYGKEQKDRYKKGLPNLIYTNGTDFEFIVKGEVTGFVQIADLIPSLPARPDQFDRLEMLLKDFASQTPISINTAKQLAEIMAAKAALIKNIMGNALTADSEAGEPSDLIGQYEGFKTSLIHDITIADFADVYAETIAYGLFAARLHDTSLDSFNRAEALELLPKSNPFLRNLFVYIAGPNLDDRLRRMIDDLCDVFRACDVGALMQDFGKFTARNDPFLHFYETFLAEYNPAKRKARGVWYTPEPVVNFIVRAVDDVLKTEFNLPMGLADTSKISIDWDSGQNDAKGRPVMTKKDVHRVQILDPATGTGTFLAEAIKQIAAQVKDVAPAMWSSYVERDLIPRLHGFELLMASYAMCHMKLDMMLTEKGYKPSVSPPRLGVYLTNSLEEGDEINPKLPFTRWLAEEAKGANTIKRDTPIMCVIGNPPYSGHSSNKGPWIEDLMGKYMLEPGGLAKLDERNPKWVKKDEHKFIRFAENMIEKNGEGILAFITSHGYLSDPTLRGMRWHLLQTFDKIYVLDLHGNANKKEVAPDGGIDKNVFDIKQGVSIIVAVKRAAISGNDLAKVNFGELWGTREQKYDQLWSETLYDSSQIQIAHSGPQFPFVPRIADGGYDAGFNVMDLLPVNTTGIQSGSEEDLISIDRDKLSTSLELNFPSSSYELCSYLHKPFDQRWFAYFEDPSAYMASGKLPKSYRARSSVSKHLTKQNVALLFGRTNKSQEVDHFFLSASMSDVKCAERSTGSMFAPLYLYPEEGTLETERRVNFDPKIYAEIRAWAGLGDTSTKSSPSLLGEVAGAPATDGGADAIGVGFSAAAPPPRFARSPSPSKLGEDLEEIPDELLVFDYIYGVLHSPDYRRTYAQFLKIDFPRIPYPASPAVFAHVADKGGQLRRLHLMEDAAIGAAPYPFMGDGDGVVVKPAFSESSPSTSDGEVAGGATAATDGGASAVESPSVSPVLTPGRSTSPSQVDGEEKVGRVFINPDQYFEGVPQIAWEFHIGGYQPAQKWLKDRKGRALSFEDVMHYQRIIKILCETDRIMKEITLPL